MFDISGDPLLRRGATVEAGAGDTVETGTVLTDDVLHPDTVAYDIKRVLADLDGSGHGPGVLDQRRQSQRGHDEADVLEPRQPPGLHDQTETLDALVEPELLHRGHQLQVDRAIAALAHNEEAGPLPDQRVARTAAHGGKMREDRAHHRRSRRRIETGASEHTATFESEQIDRVLVVVHVDLTAGGLA